MSSRRRRTQQYSLETKNFIQDTMKSIKLPTRRRKLIEKHVQNGDPMPIFREQTAPTTSVVNAVLRPRQCKSARIKKRTKSAMIEQGAYDVEKFAPVKNASWYLDRDEEKRKLQDIFSGIKSVREETFDTKVDKEISSRNSQSFTYSKNEQINELMEQVQDRIEFLQIMRQLGFARKYEFDMTLEISQKLARLRKLSEQ